MPETIGDRLRKARQARKLSLQEVARATHVRIHYLQALEEDDLEALPSAVQGRGFLRIYADYLKVNLAPPAPAAEPPAAPPPPPVPVPEPGPAEPEVPEPEPLPPVPAGLSRNILLEIGQSLRHRRELLSITLEEIERHTHVRQRNLEALEKGDLEQLASPVQARGMLTAYARFLDMDLDAVLLRFADALQARRAERTPAPPVRRRRRPILPPSMRALLSVDLFVGGGLILTLLVFAIWGAAKVLDSQQTPSATEAGAPSISDVLLLSPVPGAPTASGDAEPTLELQVIETEEGAGTATPFLPTQPSLSNVQVLVQVVQRAWMRVLVDGEVVFEGRVTGGSVYPFEADVQIEILTSNGAGLDLIYNQQRIGPMGGSAEVVNRIYTRDAVLLPTPTVTPTPTQTARVTPTPTPTSTPVPASGPQD